MSDNNYESQKRWNSAKYKQMNLKINPGLTEAFRIACEQNGNSMRKVLVEYMSMYATVLPVLKKPDKGYDERGHRRKSVRVIVGQLMEIREAEESYKENMPENLKNSSRYIDAKQTVEVLDKAIELLGESFI